MKLRAIVFVTLLFSAAPSLSAASLKETLMRLDPEERAHQACILKGIDAVRAAKVLPGADRMKTSIFGRADFDGKSHVVAKGGAVRAKQHWYRLAFDCTVTADQMTATAFSYQLGAEIPKTEWETLGLWQ
jgi:hypothetical protein